MKPFGKQPFSWKSDPQYQEQKKYKLQKLHEKILMDQLTTNKDKYGNIVKKQIPVNKTVSQDVIDSKKKRYEMIVDEQIRQQRQKAQQHPCNVVRRTEQPKKERRQDSHQIKSKYQVPINNRPKPVDKTVKYPHKPSYNNSKSNKGKQTKIENCSQFLYQRYGGVSGPDTHLIQMLEKEIVTPTEGVTMNDIADLDNAKSLLQQAALLPIFLPNFFQGIRKAWKGVLMFGPPGTGKTMLAKAIANTGKLKFFNISASSLASKWRGQSQKLVRLLFEMARFYAPSIIFIDQIDSIASRRSDNECQASRKVKTQLLIQIDGAGSQSDKPVILLAATNRPWDLDEALRRRLQKRIYIPLPTQNGRKQLFQKYTKDLKLSPNIDFNLLVQKTKGFSGADLVTLIRSASFLTLRRYLKKVGFEQNFDIQKCKKAVDIPLTQQDFTQALLQCNSSVGKDSLEQYSKWMQEFGSI